MIGASLLPIPRESAPTVIQLESRGSCELQLADLVQNGQLEVFPHVERRGLLFLQFRRSRVTLSAGPFVGLIPLTPRIVVDVSPKLPVSNLARVLDTARASLASVAGMDRLYRAEKANSPSILEFIAVNFIDALRHVNASGFHKEYLGLSGASSQARGRVDLMGTVRNCWSRGNRHQLWTHRFEQTSNVSANRVIRAALELVLLKGRIWFGGSTGILKSANALYRELPKAVGALRGDDVDRCKSIIEKHSMPTFRGNYYRALEIAILLLSGRSVSLQEHGEDVALGTYIVNFEDLFEAYLRRSLQDRCGPQFWVRDGNREGRKSLFDDLKDPPAQPDIVIVEQATRKKLIAEIKYKERPNRDDINQAITYAVSYRTNKVVLVHQLRSGAPAGLRKIGTIDGIELSGYAFDLARADLEAEEALFSDRLFSLARAD